MSLGEWLDAVTGRAAAQDEDAADVTWRDPHQHERDAPDPRRTAGSDESGRSRSARDEDEAATGPDALRAIARRLDRLGGRAAGHGAGAESARATVRDLEKQLRNMADAVAATEAGEAEAEAEAEAAAERERQAARAAAPDAGSRRRPMEGLRRAIDDITARQRTLERSAPPPAATPKHEPQDLESKIRALSGRLDRHHGMAEEVRAEFNRFEEKFDAATAGIATQVGERLRAAERQSRAEFDGVRAEVRDVARDLSEARRRDTETLKAELAALTTRLDSLPATAPDAREWAEEFAGRIETATAGEMSALRAEMGEATRYVEELMRAELDALKNEFRQLSDRVENAGPASKDLDERLEDFALRLDTATRGEIAQLREEMRDIARTVEAKLDAAGSGGDRLDTRLDDLASQLDATTKREIAELREEIRAIAAGTDGGSGSELGALRAEIAKVADMLSLGAAGGAGTGDAAAGLAEIRDGIRGLGARIDGSAEGHAALRDEVRALNERLAAQGPERFEQMERRIDELADRLEGAGGTIDPAALAQLEVEVVRLSKLLAEPGRGGGDMAGVEAALSELFDKIEADRAAAIVAARDAAEEAVTRVLDNLGGAAADSSVGLALREELAALRSHADASEQRTQGTLDAVHDTLQKIVERLARLEDDMDTGAIARTVPPAGTLAEAPEDAATAPAEETDDGDPIVGRIAAVTRAFRNEIDDNTPLAPGSGRPATARDTSPEEDEDVPTEDVPAAAGAGDEDGEGRSSRPRDFIAAARRAAQANATPAAADAPGARLVPDAEDESTAGFRPMAVMKQYKRPLLIATAIIVIAVGASQAFKMLGSGTLDLGWIVDERPAVAALPPQSPAEDVARTEAGSEAEAAPAPVQATPGDTGTQTVRQATAAPAATTTAAPPVAPAPAGETAVPSIDTQPQTTADAAGTMAPAAAAAAPETADPIATGSIPTADVTAGIQSLPTIDTAGAATAAASPAAAPLLVPPLDAAIGPETLRTAATGGDAAAQYEVATRYMEGTGVEASAEDAAKWYRLAAAQGLAPAQYRLGGLYEKGEGVEQDLGLARVWYQRAAEQGNRKAMHNLAVLYADGPDGQPDYERAAIWFRQAAEHGLRDSQYNLAILYARGLGVTQNLAESYKWFAIASASGDTEAGARRADVGKRLEADAVARLDEAVRNFQPKALVESANTVERRADVWDAAPTQDRQAGLDRETLVRHAQSRLALLGYDVGTVDGKDGPRTREAVRAFQRTQGLAETGQIDPLLVDRLREVTG